MKIITIAIFKDFILGIFFLFFRLAAQGQVLVQDFNELDFLEEFVADPPGLGQVNRMNLTLADDETPIFSLALEGGNQFLQIDKNKKQLRHFDRTTGLNDELFLRLSFDFTVINADIIAKFGAFFIGDTLNNNSFYPDKKERWAQIGIFVNPNGSFYLTHENLYSDGEIFEVSRTSSFTGTQRISLITSNSEEENTLVYIGPNGEPTELSTGKVHIWVGKDYLLEGPALDGESAALNAVKFLLWGSEQIASVRLDNISITQDISVDPLPVTLRYFSAKEVKEDVILEWETASEINSDFFVVERSMNGKDFTAIGKKKAAGESQRNVAYTFVDELATTHLAGTLYYRLQQVDIDGYFEYSPIAQLILPPFSSISSTISPNPFDQQLQVKMASPKTFLLKVRLLTVQGKLVLEDQQLMVGGGLDHVYTLNCPEEIMAGIYVLEIQQETKVQQFWVVKL